LLGYSRVVGNSEVMQKRASRKPADDLREEDFWTTSKCAIKCRTRFAVTQAEVAIAIATSLHR